MASGTNANDSMVRVTPRAAAMCSGADSRTGPMRIPSGPSPGGGSARGTARTVTVDAPR